MNILTNTRYGLWNAPHAYFKRGWCVFDFVIIFSAYLEVPSLHFRPECEASSVIHMLLIFSVPALCMSDFSASIWGAATWKRTILASAPRLAPALILVWKSHSAVVVLQVAALCLCA